MTVPAVHPFLFGLLTDEADPGLVPPPDDAAGWALVIEEAEAESLLPFLARWLNATTEQRSTFAPPAERIKPILATIAARNLVLAEELTNLLRRFQAERLPCIPFRGPALAEQLYRDVTVRTMSDLDILVPRTRLSDVGGILADLGYREIDRRPGFARAYSYTLEFVKERPAKICVEPHWTIAYPPCADRVDMDAVWARAVPGTVCGVETLLLSRIDLLLHLCFHLIHKGELAPLLWWHELALVIRQEPDSLDWTQVLHIARQTGQGELLAGLLDEVRALFGSPVPMSILVDLKASAEPASQHFLHRRLTPLLRGDSGVDGRESLAHLLTMKGFQAKWRYVCGILFPSQEFMRSHYGLSGRSWLGFRYLARLLYFLREGGRGLAGLVTSRPAQRPPNHASHASIEPPRSITSRRSNP